MSPFSPWVAADRVSVTDAVRWLVGVEGDADLSVILVVPKREGRVEPRVKSAARSSTLG